MTAVGIIVVLPDHVAAESAHAVVTTSLWDSKS